MPELTDEQIQQQVKEAEAGKAPKEVEVRLATGQVYKGATEAEVISELVKAQESASETIRAERERREQTETLLRDLSKKVPSETRTGDKKTFDNMAYLQKWQVDPIAAERDAIRFTLEEMFGVDAETLVEAQRFSHTKALQLEQLQHQTQFLATHPEFIGREGEKEYLLSKVQEMGHNVEDPADIIPMRDWENALYAGVREGKIKVEEQQEEPAPRTRRAPPQLESGGGGRTSGIEAAEQAIRYGDVKDAEKLLRNLGAFKQ